MWQNIDGQTLNSSRVTDEESSKDVTVNLDASIVAYWGINGGLSQDEHFILLHVSSTFPRDLPVVSIETSFPIV